MSQEFLEEIEDKLMAEVQGTEYEQKTRLLLDVIQGKTKTSEVNRLKVKEAFLNQYFKITSCDDKKQQSDNADSGVELRYSYDTDSAMTPSKFKESRTVTSSNNSKATKQQEEEFNAKKIENDLKKFIKLIDCSHCDLKFNTYNGFFTHIENYEIDLQCSKCKQHCDKGEYVKHLALCHNIFAVQCAYCHFGSNIEYDVINHSAKEHPKLPPRRFCRLQIPK